MNGEQNKQHNEGEEEEDVLKDIWKQISYETSANIYIKRAEMR